MTENHGANRKDGGTDPNDDGGLLLGNEWHRFHDMITAMRSLGSYAGTGSFASRARADGRRRCHLTSGEGLHSTPEKPPRHDEIITQYDQDNVDRERDYDVDGRK